MSPVGGISRSCSLNFSLLLTIVVLASSFFFAQVTSLGISDPTPPPGDVSNSELQALLCLRLHLSNTSGALDSWKSSGNLDYCAWPGVTCSRSHASRVAELDLESAGLDGQIPPCIANLTFLTRIHLPNNQLSGEIPPELGALHRLRYLNFSSNHLSGTIPNTLSSCSHLQTIDLGINLIHGEIPLGLKECLNLQVIFLDHNKLYGNIPEGLGMLPNLSKLLLAGNNLSGNIPFSLGSSPSLTAVDLTNNRLTGGIPEGLGMLPNLSELILAGNNLSGNIPFSLGSSPSLTTVVLTNNSLTGGIPPFLANSSSLQFFEGNLLDGRIPESFTNLRGIIDMDLSRNNLSGEIPKFFESFSSLKLLNLSFNNLEGPIPTEGKYGSIYKGRFDSEGYTVAIKVFKLDQVGAPKSFVAECEALRNTRHRNLVKVITACSTCDTTGREFKALILDCMANEYGVGRKISTEGDIYSYEIMILEMLTGKRPTDEMFKDGLSIHKFVEKSFPQKICDIIDPSIIPNNEDDNAESNLDRENHAILGFWSCTMQLLKLGLSCSIETPRDRPTAQDVYSEVTTIKEAFSALRSREI
ncbi:hypothetical protein GUJ93_ZPchr0012g22004 [Zizania palustris]|uniref:Protein kinase domain-containing protein n=1 Tax=Zizania palustris TaxID=103762 RepID=A0A8J5WWH2_ZIZPA|nr:hypothetical protein GUJ93_ZPchr0012g22004 [Zizania palustris]